MTKFRYKTISKRPVERSKPKSIPRKIKNKSETKLKQVEEDDLKLLFHCKNCEYDVIKDVITKDFGFELTEDDKADFDIIWHNTGLKAPQIKRLRSHQKYNHFPGTYQLAKKTNLGRNLMKMNKLHPEEYSFFPKTFVLPNDYQDFVKHSKSHDGQTYIVKPDMLSQGKGIFLTKDREEINPRGNLVVQEYMEKPFLVDNLKFDIRLYVYVTSVDPLRIYLFDDGLVRFATEEYQAPNEENIKNTYIHLTNYSINKNNKNFQFNESDSTKGHKRTLSTFWKSLNEQGIETGIIQDEIKDIIIKSFLAVQPQLAHDFKSCLSEDIDNSTCFEILGFDIMLDENLDPYLIEVNHAPAFGTDSKIDLVIKQQLLRDSFRMLNMSLKRKIKYKKEANKIAQNRIFTGRNNIVTQDDKIKTRKSHNIGKHRFEMANKGHYELLYPIVDESDNILGEKEQQNYGLAPMKQISEESTSDCSKNSAQKATKVEEKPKTEKEKTAEKYEKFIEDAFEVWDDLMSGFRFKSRHMHAEDDEPTKKQKEDLLNSRNPRPKNMFQKTVRMNKPGFGSSAKRIDIASKRLSKKMETPKPAKVGNLTEVTKKRGLNHHKHTGSKHQNMLMQSVLNKYVSKSIVITHENDARRKSQADGKPIKGKVQGKGLPVISNPKTLKELQLKNCEAQPSVKATQSNKNSMPRLPKVL